MIDNEKCTFFDVVFGRGLLRERFNRLLCLTLDKNVSAAICVGTNGGNGGSWRWKHIYSFCGRRKIDGRV